MHEFALLLDSLCSGLMKKEQDILHLQAELVKVRDLLVRKEAEIRDLMITDKLTTLYTRQHLNTVLKDEIARCERYSRPLALIMIDIDDFKSLNERYGHQAGDSMLSFAGSLIKESTRSFDRAFRYGGEEFVVVLPESELTMAYIVAERIRKGFEQHSFSTVNPDGTTEALSRTISAGITATYAYSTDRISTDAMIDQTESALSTAKEKGGNMCIRYE
jgi:diguanylate cyclase (GGDEF)-like protein